MGAIVSQVLHPETHVTPLSPGAEWVVGAKETMLGGVMSWFLNWRGCNVTLGGMVNLV